MSTIRIYVTGKALCLHSHSHVVFLVKKYKAAATVCWQASKIRAGSDLKFRYTPKKVVSLIRSRLDRSFEFHTNLFQQDDVAKACINELWYCSVV